VLDLGYYRYSDIIHLVSQRHDDSNYLLSDVLCNFNYTLSYSASLIPCTPSDFKFVVSIIQSDIKLDMKQELMA